MTSRFPISMTIFDAHGVLTFRAKHRIREPLKGGGGILYYLYLSSNLRGIAILARMQDYKRGSHPVWDCKYHLVWTTKYRYQVLGGEVGQRCRALVREVSPSENNHLRGSDESGSCASALRDPPFVVSVACGSAHQGEKFSSVAQ